MENINGLRAWAITFTFSQNMHEDCLQRLIYWGVQVTVKMFLKAVCSEDIAHASNPISVILFLKVTSTNFTVVSEGTQNARNN